MLLTFLLLSTWACHPCSAEEGLKKGTVTFTERPRNSNWLLNEYRSELAIRVSSFWPGWPAERLTDGNLNTSWFTARGDSSGHGKHPEVEINLPRAEKIRRVTVFGNREPSWRYGFGITNLRLEFYDREGCLIESRVEASINDTCDIDCELDKPLEGVCRIKLTSMADEGAKNSFGDVAIAEIQIE